MSLFLQFAEVSEALAATTKKLEKRDLIATWLQTLSMEDAGRAALWLCGMPFPEIDARALNVGGSLLSRAILQLSGVGAELLSEAYRRYGDLGAAAADLLYGRAPAQASLTLVQVESALAALADARGPDAKLRLLLDLLARATPEEAKYLIKLITGDMRTGVKQALVEEAIAEAWATPVAAVRRADMLLGSLPELVALAAAGRTHEARMKLFHPLGFMLASSVASVQEAIARFTEEVAAEREQGAPIIAKAALREAQLEDKFDGIRAQLHVASENSGPSRVALYSRNREDLSESFPDLVEAFSAIAELAILDGEILAWNPAEARALPFSVLQQRLGRKRVTAEMLRAVPVALVVFDVLYRGDQLLLTEPLAHRRSVLENFCARWCPLTASAPVRGQSHFFDTPAEQAFPRLILTSVTRLDSAAQLERAYLGARSRGNEGVMIKSLASAYQPGRRGLAWLKLKRELATLDVVVTGVEFGNGRRAQVLSDYTFAVRDPADPAQPIKNIGKAYSGLTDQEIAEMTAFFRAHTLEEFGHFRTVEPLVVLEVAFNNLMRSTRHASGFALRFPRILRIRTDKPVAEIDTLRRVEEIYASQPDKPVEAGSDQ
ncbi:MAG TPA: ATP-dependent DNA ligase [Acidobacteriaceae bacterium]|nr:ATP-dependent DNA ligase [Acidobacteriaceae bacterium]